MKPLPVIQLTLEDWNVWHWSKPDWNDMARLELMDAYEAAGDADFRLILAIEQVRAHAQFRLDHIVYMLLRGWLYCDTIGIGKI
jgi:hypothetical protein